MPTRDPISTPNTRTVAVVVDPAKYDTCTSMRWGSSTPIEERPMYIIDSPQSTDDDEDEIGPFLSTRRVGERDITAVRIPTGSIGALYPESKFFGHQKSGKSEYEVEITIKHVDLRENSLSGFLHIRNLSEQDITTFFTGEFITSSQQFFENPYGAEPTVDIQHWSKFPQFSDLMDFWANVYPEDPDFRYDFMKSDIIFARWKERHFVPDHKQDIRGACFAGFYYVSYQKSTGNIIGWYYHKSSEMNQKLTLKHCPGPQGKIPIYEFR